MIVQPGKVRSFTLGGELLISESLPRVDYSDAFAIDVDPSLPTDPQWWAQMVRDEPPGPVAALMAVRNAAMRPFGLKTEGSEVFKSLDRTENELLMGTDDRHLCFRGNLLVVPGDDRLTLAIGTVVQFNNFLGRAYFLLVKPVHSLVIVPMVLRHAARTATEQALRSD